MLKRIIIGLLYVLPIIFSFVCYFLIVTSGEDIHQGANTAPNIIADALAAFNHSARLADMYAWAVINFFDYTYQFGVDTVFRVIDVMLAGGLIYLTTYMALGRRPKYAMKDAVTFALIFLALMLTSNGNSLYGGFSKIHNYLLIGIISVGFGLIYMKSILASKMPEKWWLSVIMLMFGFVFGLTSSVTAVAFLICMPLYLGYLYLSRQKVAIKKSILSWQGAGVLGILIAIFCIYGIGPGLAEYGTSEIYKTVCDYLAFDELFIDVADSAKRIVQHNLFNFGRFLAPFMVMTVPVAIYGWCLYRRNKLKKPKITLKDKNYIVAGLLFVFIHILALSQIYYFTRMVLPVYLIAVAIYLFMLSKIFISVKNMLPLAIIVIVVMAVLVMIRGYLAVEYLKKASPVFESIRKSDTEVYCVNASEVKSFNFPYIYLGQEDFLVDWALPQTIYGKKVDLCK